MSLTELLYQQAANGIFTGSLYALAAVGLTMVFGVLRAINFAHGEFYMLGAVASWVTMTRFDLPYSVTIPLAVVVGAVLAFLVARTIIQPLVDAPFQRALLATIGIYLILQNAVQLSFGGTHKTFTAGFMGPVSFAGIRTVEQRIVILTVAVAAFACLQWMVRSTRIGKAMRAVSQNKEACAVVGIDVGRVARFTFVLGIVLASLAGALMAPIVVNIHPAMGKAITLKAFAIIVIGGMGNVKGTLWAAMLLGLVESLVASFVGMQLRDAIGFVALLLVLLWRPTGLFGLKARF